MQNKQPALQGQDWEAIWKAKSFAPLVFSGPVLETVRRTLLARAAELGFQHTDALDVHLNIEGQLIAPLEAGDGHVVFLFPASTKLVRLVSRSGVPKHHDPMSDDGRHLGIAVTDIEIDDGMCSVTRIGLLDPGLAEGFHPIERDGDRAWRWTDGNALLRNSLWSSFTGIVKLRVNVMGVQRAWQ